MRFQGVSLALLLVLGVHFALAQDILKTPSEKGDQITWAGCASDDTRIAIMSIDDFPEVGRIDHVLTSSVDLEISRCPTSGGELILKFGREVVFGASTIDRDGAIRFNPDSEGVEDLEYRKNGAWVSLTAYSPDDESKLIPGEATEALPSRLLSLSEQAPSATSGGVIDNPSSGVDIIFEESTGLFHFGMNIGGKRSTIVSCDLVSDPTCEDSSSTIFPMEIIDADYFERESTVFYTFLDGDDILVGNCTNTECDAVSVANVEDTFSRDVDMFFTDNGVHLLKRNNATYDIDLSIMGFGTSTLWNWTLESQVDPLFSTTGAPVDTRNVYGTQVAANVINGTLNGNVTSFFASGLVALGDVSSYPNNIDFSLYDAVYKLVIHHCTTNATDVECERTYVPNGIRDELLLGAEYVEDLLDYDQTESSPNTRALKTTLHPELLDTVIVDRDGEPTLFAVIAARRPTLSSPPGDLIDANYYFIAFACQNTNCTDYETRIIASSNELNDGTIVGRDQFQSMFPGNLHVSLSESGFPLITIGSLFSSPVLVHCYDANCDAAELTVGNKYLSGHLGYASAIQANGLTILSSPSFWEWNNSPILEIFNGNTTAPDAQTPCNAESAGLFFNAGGRTFGCTKLPKRIHEKDSAAEATSTFLNTILWQWTPIGGSLDSRIADTVLDTVC